MSNKIVTSIYNVIDDNIEQINDTRIICIDIAKGFVGLHKSDPICALDVNGTINCQYLYINDVSINTIIVNYNSLNKNLIPLNDNTINLGIATKYWLNAYIYNLSAESINITTNINPFTNATGSLGSTSNYWGNDYIRDLSGGSIDISVSCNPLVHLSGSLGISDRMWRNAYIRDLSVVSIDVSVNCNPLTRGTGSLGSTSKYWNNAYIRDLSIGSIDVSVNLNPLTNGTGSLGMSGRMWGNAYIRDLSAASIDISVNCYPFYNGTGSLGSTTKYWSNAYIQDLSVTNINRVFNVNTVFNINTISYENVIIDIVPKNATESLGLSNKKWGNAYIRDLSVGSVDISVNLNMKNNSIKNINTLTADVSNYNITTTARIYQNICGDISWNAVNGYYGLAKDAYPSLNPYSSGKNVVSNWIGRVQSGAYVNGLWQSVCWSSELGIFVAVASWEAGSIGIVMTSNNGINWTNISISAGLQVQGWTSVCWSPELSIFLAVSSKYNTSNRVMYSRDGKIWTSTQQSIVNRLWRSVCWSPELGIFVVVASEGNNNVMTSPDGISWTSNSNFVDTFWYDVCWSPQLGIFVAVGDDFNNKNGLCIMYSSNGKSWTRIAVEKAFEGQSVCWSPQLGIFVAVSRGGLVMISNNGITWIVTIVTNNYWSRVCWSPELGIFTAVAWSNDLHNIMTSPDGITWTILQQVPYTYMTGVCWSPELGIFVAVSDSGIYPVITSSLKRRPPTSYNVFDSSFNSIDESGNWTFSKIITPSANIIDLSVNRINGQDCTNLIHKINMILTNP